VPPGPRDDQQDFTAAGATMTFAFANLPPPSNDSATVTVELLGDYAGTSKHAEVAIDNQQQATHSGGTSCSTAPDSKTYTMTKNIVANGKVTVVVKHSPQVHASCTTPNRVIVRLSYTATPAGSSPAPRRRRRRRAQLFTQEVSDSSLRSGRG
jgi:hypothetical protein